MKPSRDRSCFDLDKPHLKELVGHAPGVESEALEAKLATVTGKLREARRARRIESSFARYTSTTWDKARETRIKTLARDTLVNQPDWVIDELRGLHTAGQLASHSRTALANHLVANAIVLDGGRPLNRTAPAPTPIEIALA